MPRVKRDPDAEYFDRHGTTWFRPTAWAYFAVCRALSHHQEQARRALLCLETGDVVGARRELNKPVDSRPDQEWDRLRRDKQLKLLESRSELDLPASSLDQPVPRNEDVQG